MVNRMVVAGNSSGAVALCECCGAVAGDAAPDRPGGHAAGGGQAADLQRGAAGGGGQVGHQGGQHGQVLHC